MGAKSARAYNRNQAKFLVEGLQRIKDRISLKSPHWLLKELSAATHKAQCIQEEFEWIMKDYGDFI